MERAPKGAKIFFWYTPDNYKGCYVGFPFLEEPFYGTKGTVMGYQSNYSSIGGLPASLLKGETLHYVYDQKTGSYSLKSADYLKSNNITRLYLKTGNIERFRKFIRRLRGK